MKSTASASAPVGFWAKVLGWFRGTSASSDSVAVTSAPADSEENAVAGNYVIAPSGYQIRVPTGSAIPEAVGELLPEVRAGLTLIPPLPHVVGELLREIQKPSASASSVAAVISSDPALAASVLRMVNRAACGLSRKVTSVPEAVSYLGFGVVKSLVLRLRLDSVLPAGTQASQEMRELWTHALSVSYIADVLAESVGGVDRGYVSTLALLHDIGKIALLTRFPERAAALKQAIRDGTGQTILAHEARLLGADHAAMGASLALQWKLPADLVQAIRWHHAPAQAFGPSDPPALARAVLIVHVANQLAKFCYAYSDEMEIEGVLPASLESLGLAPSLDQLLTARVRAAAAKAIYMAEESAELPPTAQRRLILLHEGDGGARLLKRIAGCAESRAVRVNPDVTARLENVVMSMPEEFERKLKGPSADEVRNLMDSLRSQLDQLNVTAEQSQSAALVAQSILSALAATVPSPLTVCQWLDGERLCLGFRSSSLSFAHRFGAGVDAATAARALEAELGNVLNLGWVRGAQTNPSGECLILELELKSRPAIKAVA